MVDGCDKNHQNRLKYYCSHMPLVISPEIVIISVKNVKSKKIHLNRRP